MEHRADALFALPRIPRTAAVFGELAGWKEDLTEREIALVLESPRGDRPDLAVATADRVQEAVASGAAGVIVDGARSKGSALPAAGFATRRLLPLPVRGSPVLYVDLDHRQAARYGLHYGITHTERWRAARNRVAGMLAGAGLLPSSDGLVAVSSRTAGEPALLQAAQELGIDSGGGWLMVVSPGSVVRRNAFLVFPLEARKPGHVVRFARRPGLTIPFERDARGAALVAAAGGSLAAHAPRYLGRVEVDGYCAAIETAAPGTKLAGLLRTPMARQRKLAVVEMIADWLVRVAKETTAPPETLESERERFATDVLPFWSKRGVGDDLLAGLPRVPAAFQHNDMAEENVVVDRGGFIALDWEWAQPHGLPLGDLVYFGVHVLRLVDGRLLEGERDPHFEELVTGRAPTSPVFFRWIRELVAALELPPESIGPLVTLSWLDRSRLSTLERERAESTTGKPLGEAYAERCARTWLSHPALGPGWDLWRR